MSVYSKANGYCPSLAIKKDEIKAKLMLEYAQIEKKLEKLAKRTAALIQYEKS